MTKAKILLPNNPILEHFKVKGYYIFFKDNTQVFLSVLDFVVRKE